MLGFSVLLRAQYLTLSAEVMSRVERFEDLIAWQKARALTQAVYQVTRHGDFAKDFGLSGQIQRAAVSIMSNIAKGFERRSNQIQPTLRPSRRGCQSRRWPPSFCRKTKKKTAR